VSKERHDKLQQGSYSTITTPQLSVDLRGLDASCCVIIIGKEVEPSIATVCVCALLLHVEHYSIVKYYLMMAHIGRNML
jgi:hypothetical protein